MFVFVTENTTLQLSLRRQLEVITSLSDIQIMNENNENL